MSSGTSSQVLALLVGRLEVVEDVLEVEVDLAAPVRHRLGVEDLQALAGGSRASSAGSFFISEIWRTISASSPLRALKTYFSSVRKSYLLISPRPTSWCRCFRSVAMICSS